MANLGVLLQQRRRAERKAGNSAVTFSAQFSPLAVKAAIVEGNYDAALAGLKEAIKPTAPPCRGCERPPKPEPWAIRAWMEAAGAVGAMTQVLVTLNASLGVRDETELRDLVDTGRRVKMLTESADARGIFQFEGDAIELLKAIIQMQPERRGAIIAQLDSGAELVEAESGNGE